MNGTYYCGNNTSNTIQGRSLYLLIEDWTNCGYGVKQTATGFEVTFANGYVRSYTRVN